jgi:uncharacterized lipoprotein NlpE involved in copper resistance
MKKIILSLAILAATITGCNNPQDDDLATLEGTTWIYRHESDDVYGEMSFKFGKTMVSVSSTLSYLLNGKWETENMQDAGTYVYDPPVVVITIDDETETGTVSGSEMVFTFEDEVLIFIRE